MVEEDPMTHWTDGLHKLNVCKEALEWAAGFPSFEEAWNHCKRGDWMLWLLAKLEVDRKALTLAACACVRLALPYTTDGRVLASIEMAEAWARGDASIEEVRSAATAAFAAALAAFDVASAHDAAYAAAYAAYAAAFTAYDDATAAAAAETANDGARNKVLRQCADIVRERFATDDVSRRFDETISSLDIWGDLVRWWKRIRT
jgi:hypothetical protein